MLGLTVALYAWVKTRIYRLERQTDLHQENRLFCTKFNQQQGTIARLVGMEHTSCIVRLTGSVAFKARLVHTFC